MKLMLLLGIHGLLILIYAVFVATGRSRMRWLHLLFAFALPFVGELCLLLSEFDVMPARPLYTTPFRRKQPEDTLRNGPRLPENWRTILHSNEASARAFLLDVIARNCEGVTEVLHEALRAPGSEVPHIAAATLMRLHAQHEERISHAQHMYECSRNNIAHLRDWINAIDAYRISGLNTPAALHLLETEEIDLIQRYLTTMQKDVHHRAILITLLMKHQPEQSYREAQLLLSLRPEDPHNWNLVLDACLAARHEDYAALKQRLHMVSSLWPQYQREKLHARECIDHADQA